MQTTKYLQPKTDKPPKKGFTIIEAIITLFIVALGFIFLFTVFQMTMRQSAMTRHWLVATMLADSMLQELRAHPYGEVEPKSWRQPRTVNVVIQGRKITMTYEIEVTYQNGSFINPAAQENYDYVTVTLTWEEGTGIESSGRQKKYSEAIWVRRSM